MVAVSRLDLTSKPQTTGWRNRAAWALNAAAVLALTLPVAMPAQAEDSPQTTGNPNFIPAPSILSSKDGSFDTILGVHVNVIFLVAVVVVALLWFTIGGGRKAKVKRS